MILSYDKISSLTQGPGTNWVFNPAVKAMEGFLGPQPTSLYVPYLYPQCGSSESPPKFSL